jgi:deoxyribonuclease V
VAGGEPGDGDAAPAVAGVQLTTRCGAADVHYPPGGGAVAALVVADDATFANLVAEHTARLPDAAPYRSGRFAERELPALRAVVAAAGRLDLLVVDGYVQLDGQGSPGLGAHAATAFGLPVIGVAKTRFRSADHAAEVRRGGSVRPLYVTAAGIPLAAAAALVGRMAGRHRVPDALRRADALSRGG